MLRQILYRLLISIPALFGVILFGFALLMLVPSDPAAMFVGEHATPENLAAARLALGLDRPLWEQFGNYLFRLLHGDLGRSLLNGTSVSVELAAAFGPTVELVFGALIWSVPTGIALGTVAAIKRGKIVDRCIVGVSVLGVSTPVFLTGLLLIKYVAEAGNMFPVQGRGCPVWTIEGLTYLVLPALTLGSVLVGPIARITRTSMLEILSSDFVRTARAKGVSETRVIVFHALRLALIPIVTLIGLQAGHLLGGAVVVEEIFAWPGLGRLARIAITSRDQPMAQGAILVLAFSFVLVNLIVDVLCSHLDPRVRPS